MDVKEKRESMGQLVFLSMLDNEVMLWSDTRLEFERQSIFDIWCFDTGADSDLKKFHELDREVETRKTWTLPTYEDQA